MENLVTRKTATTGKLPSEKFATRIIATLVKLSHRKIATRGELFVIQYNSSELKCRKYCVSFCLYKPRVARLTKI